MLDFFEHIREKEEKVLLNFFENTFNLKAIHNLLQAREQNAPDNFLPCYMREYHMQVREGVCEDVFALCSSAASDLGFADDAIEFYIANDDRCNSFSIANNSMAGPHFVVLNRGLIERTTPEELRFIVGHEIGHLLFDHSYVSKTIKFIYPDKDRQPPLLQKLFDAWEKICEISADRVGLIASGDIDASVKALHRLSSGLGGERFVLDTSKISGMAHEAFKEMKRRPSYVPASHPANTLRIMALKRFYGSGLWRSVVSGNGSVDDEAFERSMDEILSIVKRSPLNELEVLELSFMASAGMLLMVSDRDVDDDEYSFLINALSRYTHWPPEYLDRMDKADMDRTMRSSADAIVSQYPWRSKELLGKLFHIINRDNKIKDNELSMFMDIGTSVLKLNAHIVVDIVLEGMKEYYKPLN